MDPVASSPHDTPDGSAMLARSSQPDLAPPIHSSGSQVSSQAKCSKSCAHHWALAPSGSFLPGTAISQITFNQLESLNLTTLTIFAESSVAKPRIHCDSPYQSHIFGQPISSYCNSSLGSHADCKPWCAEYVVTASQQYTLLGSWSCLEFECLREKLYYTTTDDGDPSKASLIWYWQDLAAFSSFSYLGGSRVVRLYTAKICEITFIQSLLLPEQRDTVASFGHSRLPHMKRSLSSPNIRSRNLSSEVDGKFPSS